MLEVLVAIFVTFCITAGWQIIATRKIRENQRFMVKAIINELDQMAIKLGYRDFATYLESTKGAEYASNAIKNLNSFYETFTARGPDSN